MITLKKFSTYLVIVLVLTLPILTYAAVTNAPLVTANIPSPTGDTDLMSLITKILNGVLMPIAAVFVTVWIIYAGFKYVVAQGNPTKVSEAHKTLLWSLIGAGILLGAAGISKVVETTIKALIQ